MSSELHTEICPPLETLSQLVAGTVDDAETLELHLRDCKTCQTTLDELSQSNVLQPFRKNEALNLASDYSYLDDPVRDNDLGSIGGLYVESEMGRGGAGIVFRAFDPSLERHVAVKVLNNEGSYRSDARFERESKAAGNLRNDYLVSVHSTGCTMNGRPYLVMPLIEGQTLSAQLRNELPTSRDSARIVRQIALGLQAVHSSGLIHRDVKPANILMDHEDGRAKLTDFGLVRDEFSAATLTQADVLSGTPEYMSPEQASTEKPGARSDIYSLGITLYECLTGSVPFRGKPLDILGQHRDLEPVPPSRMNKSIPRDLETICLKAIAKDPARRYQTATGFANDLKRFLNDETIHARPAGVLEKTWRWGRRNPRVALLTIALATTLVGGIVMTTWQWQSSRANYFEAQENYLAAQKNFDVATELILSHRQFALSLSRKAGHEIAARDLYRKILEEVNQLVVLRNDDPEVRLLQPRVYLSNAEIESIVGNAEDSITLFDRSEQLFQQLIMEKERLAGVESSVEPDRQLPPVRDLRHSLSAVVLLRGEAYHLTGDTTSALEDYGTAKSILEDHLKDTSNSNRSKEKRNLALTLVLEGHVWFELADHSKALECYQLACKFLPETMGLEKAGSANFLQEMSEPMRPSENGTAQTTSSEKHISAFVAHFLGRHLVATASISDNRASQIEQGIRLLTWSLGIRRNISTTNPYNADSPAFSDWIRDVAMTLTELAKAARQSGQIDLAIERINESVELLAPIAEKSDRIEFRLRLAQALVVRSKFSGVENSNKGGANDLLRAQGLCQSVLAISPSWQECKHVLADVEDELEKLNAP